MFKYNEERTIGSLVFPEYLVGRVKHGFERRYLSQKQIILI